MLIERMGIMKMSRIWAMPNHWTFKIKPIAELLERYGVGENWVDPFCGQSRLAEYRNDLNPEIEGCDHMLAVDYVKHIEGNFDGVIFDPPYSGRQVSEHYKHLNKKVHQDDTNAYFYTSVKDAITPKIRNGGRAISFGWNSNGFGKVRGFVLEEIVLVAHGGNHNDTIVTVERKI